MNGFCTLIVIHDSDVCVHNPDHAHSYWIGSIVFARWQHQSRQIFVLTIYWSFSLYYVPCVFMLVDCSACQ